MTWLKIVFSDEGLTALLVCLMTGGGGEGVVRQSPRYKSAAGQCTFFYRAVTLRNALPCSVTDNIVLASFKRDLESSIN